MEEQEQHSNPAQRNHVCGVFGDGFARKSYMNPILNKQVTSVAFAVLNMLQKAVLTVISELNMNRMDRILPNGIIYVAFVVLDMLHKNIWSVMLEPNMTRMDSVKVVGSRISVGNHKH